MLIVGNNKKQMKNILLFITIIFFITSCQKVFDKEELGLINNELVIRKGSSKPYTGWYIEKENRIIAEKILFIKGLRKKYIAFWDNGEMMFCNNYKNGKPHGYSKEFDSDGKLEKKAKYKNGLHIKTIIYKKEFIDTKNLYVERYGINEYLSSCYINQCDSILNTLDNIEEKEMFLISLIDSTYNEIREIKQELVKSVEGENVDIYSKDLFLLVELLKPNERGLNRAYLLSMNENIPLNQIKTRFSQISKIVSASSFLVNTQKEKVLINFSTQDFIDYTGVRQTWEDRYFKGETLLSNLYAFSIFEKELMELKLNMLVN